ncbi:MAG TPA: peptidylprolyl isomerase, partial [Planctomycetota bacterium]|nr:peptidylprolyl isomerase [Planctomycetota bacterium]
MVLRSGWTTLLLGWMVGVSTLAGTGWALQALPRTLTDQDLRALEARYMDQVVVVAGDQVITQRDLLQRLQTPAGRRKVTELAALPPQAQAKAEAQLKLETSAELVEMFLETRAGEDRGFDPKLVETLVDRRFQETIERVGGYRTFYAELQRANSSPELFKEQIRRSLYRYAWQGAITGRQAGTTGRIELDRFVRPGELRVTYKNFLGSSRWSERELLGEREKQFVLLELALGFEASGGRQAAVDRAKTVREDIEAGKVSVEEYIRHWGLRDPKAAEKARLVLTASQARDASQSSFGGPTFAEFLADAEPGDLSPVLESSLAAHIFKLVEIQPAQPARPFEDWNLQEDVRNFLLEKQARNRLGRAHRDLILESALSNRTLVEFML